MVLRLCRFVTDDPVCGSFYVWEIMHSTIKKMNKHVSKLQRDVDDAKDKREAYQRRVSTESCLPIRGFHCVYMCVPTKLKFAKHFYSMHNEAFMCAHACLRSFAATYALMHACYFNQELDGFMCAHVCLVF